MTHRITAGMLSIVILATAQSTLADAAATQPATRPTTRPATRPNRRILHGQVARVDKDSITVTVHIDSTDLDKDWTLALDRKSSIVFSKATYVPATADRGDMMKYESIGKATRDDISIGREVTVLFDPGIQRAVTVSIMDASPPTTNP